MRTVFISGGAGFIGSHVTGALLRNRYRVICADNLITGSKKNITPFLAHSNFIFRHIDITKPLQNLESAIDIVLHLASPASPNKNSPKSYINLPIETLMANSLGTYRLLELAKAHNARFVYASSSEVYGDPAVSPQPESYYGNVNPNGPRSVYDEGKRFGEALTMSYFRKHNVNVRIIRIFNTYGENMQKDDGRVISNFITQALLKKPITVYGTGQQTRSFCYISDMVEGLTEALASDTLKGEVMNLGNPEEHTILETARLVKSLTKSQSHIVFERLPEDDPRARKPDIAKAGRLIRFHPKIMLRDGLKKTINYFKKDM